MATVCLARDIKHADILFDAGEEVVAGFGAAAAVDSTGGTLAVLCRCRDLVLTFLHPMVTPTGALPRMPRGFVA